MVLLVNTKVIYRYVIVIIQLTMLQNSIDQNKDIFVTAGYFLSNGLIPSYLQKMALHFLAAGVNPSATIIT